MVTFVETKLFTRLVSEYLSDDQYSALQQAIADEPEVGSVVRGTGGVRKMRWGVGRRGKRGGVRVIYYLRKHDEVWLLTLYAKSQAESIPANVLRQIKEEIDG